MPSRIPARRRSAAADKPERASGVDRSSTGSVGGGGRGAAVRATDQAVRATAQADRATALLGRDEIAVVGLPTMADLDLDARDLPADPLRDAFGFGEVGAGAVEQRDELEAGLER
jgi:hypothetical protein